MANKELSSQASQKINERLGWWTAYKDQAGIARDLADGKPVSEIYGLGEAGLFDLFFLFFDHFGISRLFTFLDPNCRKRKGNVKFPVVMLIYLMRMVGGLAFYWHIKPVILQSQALMRLVGFNGREVRKGTCARGLHHSAPKNEDCQDGKNNENTFSSEIRGPISAYSIASYIEAIKASALERFFNSVTRVLAEASFFPKKIHAVLDASEIQSTQKCEGCGKVKKEKAPPLRLRKGRIRKVMETVFGFKIWVVWDPNSKLPIAMRFATIDVSDITLAQEVVAQAITNLGDHAKIVSLDMDRGFLDGPFMWWLNLKNIAFYIPAKKSLNVYEDALSLVNTGIRQSRTKDRRVGRGKRAHTVTDYWEVVGIEELTSAGFYGPLGSGSHENRKDFVPNPINAVVVLHDPYKENNPNSDTMVILTNASVEKPLKAYDEYDIRSEIENSVFREGKQSWFIECPAKNTDKAFRAHAYLTVSTMGLTSAFRTWMITQEKLESKGEETGVRKFREAIRLENANKCIIFEDNRYAIFETYEIVILCGTTVLKPRGEPETITREDILRKYEQPP